MCGGRCTSEVVAHRDDTGSVFSEQSIDHAGVKTKGNDQWVVGGQSTSHTRQTLKYEIEQERDNSRHEDVDFAATRKLLFLPRAEAILGCEACDSKGQEGLEGDHDDGAKVYGEMLRMREVTEAGAEGDGD